MLALVVSFSTGLWPEEAIDMLLLFGYIHDLELPHCLRATEKKTGLSLWPQDVILEEGEDSRSPCYFSENPVPYFCRASCWQPGTRTPTPPQISEDCLYLNVFVPENLVS